MDRLVDGGGGGGGGMFGCVAFLCGKVLGIIEVVGGARHVCILGMLSKSVLYNI